MATAESTSRQRRKHKKSLDSSEKWCPKCEQFLPVSHFSKHAGEKSGLESWCRKCLKAHNKATKDRYKNNKTKIEPEEKACPRCGEILPIEKFHKNSSMKNGRNSSCRDCVLKSSKQRRDDLRSGKIPFVIASEKKCDRCKNIYPIKEFYRNKNKKDGKHGTCKTCCKQIQKLKYDEKPQKYRDKALVYAKNNHEKIRFNVRKREARVQNLAVCDLTDTQWKYIQSLYNYRCAYCGKKKPLTRDHVIPIIDGGEHSMSNIVPACRSCNSKKGKGKPLVPVQTMMKLAL